MLLSRLSQILALGFVVVALSTHASAKGGTSPDESSSSKSNKWNLFSGFRKSKPEQLPHDRPFIEQARELMSEETYLELKPLWERAVKQQWIHEHTGLPRHFDGQRNKAETKAISELLSKLDPYVEELAKRLP